MTDETKTHELHDYLNCHQFDFPLVHGKDHAVACECGRVKCGDTIADGCSILHIDIKDYKELINQVGPEILARMKAIYEFKLENATHYDVTPDTAQKHMPIANMSYKDIEDYGQMKGML